MINKAPALTVAYVVKGFLGNRAHHDVLEGRSSSDGEMAVIGDLIEAAGLVEQIWRERFGPNRVHPGCWPGVWDYDISEPFGYFLARAMKASNDNSMPDEEVLLKHLNDQIDNELKGYPC